MFNTGISELLPQAQAYSPLVHEYCQLALQPTLDEAAAERVDEILQQAENDPMLSLLLDEADHLVAHARGLIDADYVATQQQRLQTSLEALWVEQLILDLRSQQFHQDDRIRLQSFLKHQGVYDGSIDGVCGPKTWAAVEVVRQAGILDAERQQLIESLAAQC